jgi:hypothetical protein
MKPTVRATAAIVAACLSILSAQAAPAPACVKGADETALQTRTVQTDLMVAALSCSASARYNDFVKGNQPALMAAHTQLTSFFTKKRGGQKAMNAFITKLANDASRRSVADIARFCQETGWLYDAILSPQRGDLSTFMRPLLVAQRHGYTPCEPRASYVVMGPSGPTEVAAATPAPPAADVTPAKAPSNPVRDVAGIPTPRSKPPTLAQR